MGLTPEELKHVASIAHITLSDKEAKLLARQADDIINWFDMLDEVDTKGVKPSFHPLETKNIFRDDEVGKSLPRDEVLSNTIHKEKGYFKGPRSV